MNPKTLPYLPCLHAYICTIEQNFDIMHYGIAIFIFYWAPSLFLVYAHAGLTGHTGHVPTFPMFVRMG